VTTGAESNPIDLAGLSKCSLWHVPYEWAFASDLIPNPTATTLRATFPQQGYWLLQDGDTSDECTYSARPLVTVDAGGPSLERGLDGEWQAVAQQIQSDEYRSAVAAAINQDLSGARVEATLWRRNTGVGVDPHLDLPDKILTQVFYFNTDWTSDFGGCLRILRGPEPEDICEELSPILGSMVILVRSDSSWHSVTPVSSAAPGPRLSMNVTWFTSDGESPVWKVEDGGRIKCVLSTEPLDEIAASG
jgi:hypothetical protein